MKTEAPLTKFQLALTQAIVACGDDAYGVPIREWLEAHASEEAGICHVPEAGAEDHVWWFGFDAAHSGDVSPGMIRFATWGGETYRDLPYMRSQVSQLAAQLHAIAAPR